MPYDIKRNYKGKSGYSVVGPNGSVRGTHSSRTQAEAQRRALYSSEEDSKKNINKSEDDLYSQLSEPEKEFHDSLISISQKYGPLDLFEETGIWVGYESEEENKDKNIGVICGNCSLHYKKDNGSIGCKILSYEIEEKGKCRLAVIPPGYVNPEGVPEEMSIKSFWGGRFV